MSTKDFSSKLKDLSLAVIDVNDQAAKSTIKAIESFIGTDYATYTYGLTFVANQITSNAREIVEKCSSFAYAGHTK